MIIDRQTIGRFTFQQCAEAFDENTDYRECLLFEQGTDYIYYVHLHKDVRFPQVDFRYPPEEKKSRRWESEDAYNVALTEYSSFQHRKDYNQPTWKLHKSTVTAIINRLHELTNAQSN